MRRIGLAVVLALSLTLAPLVADAQSAGRVHRIGYLSLQRSEGDKSWVAAFRQGLRDRGYVEGQNIVIQRRHAEGRAERLPGLASELVDLKVDVMVVYGLWTLVDAGWKAPGSLPIVALAAELVALKVDVIAGGFDPDRHRWPQCSVESLHGVAVVSELLLEDFARGRVENSDLLLSRVQITSDECHESGLLAGGLVTVPQPEPTCSGRPFS